MKCFSKRNFIQLIATALTNGYILGYSKGKIYTGKTKMVCVPVLNCYSCPGAIGSCPIGALQSVVSGRRHMFSFYILGILMLFGVIFGRLICGFLCPFGFFQDLLHKIPIPKLKISKKIDAPLRYLKYLILILMVLLLPMFLKDQYGSGTPYFCKYICPEGTLGAGIPLLLKNPRLRMAIGTLFNWKLAILILIIILSIIIYRPFCKYLCPLGAFYALFNKFSFYKLELNKDKCTGCKACESNCKMGVEITKNINSTECIRCGDCIKTCKFNAISKKQFISKSTSRTSYKSINSIK
ncbi:MAG: 4Fe-4S binding protein [Clostridium sp.]|nr:4Fe-4S binding protein [Clostridium sp.]